MKAKLRKKHLPQNYLKIKRDEVYTLKLGNMIVAEYMQSLYELNICSQVVDDALQAASWFRAGLRADIKNKLLRQPIYSVENVFQAALNAETIRIVRKFSSKQGRGSCKKEL